jgi:hypothetical protein
MAGDLRGNYGGGFAGKLCREIRGEIMAGNSRGNYGGRFAGILWLGRLEANRNTAVGDAEQ